MLRNLAVSLSQPQQLALQKFRAVMYGDHAYGRVFPTEAMVKGFTLEQVRGFYNQTYGAGRSRLYVVGRFDTTAVEAAIRKAFAAWRKGSEPSQPPAKPSSARAVHIIDRPGAPQSTVIMGMPTVDPSNADFIPLTVMDALLGGAFASRVTKNIREDKGYTYSPYSELSVRYRDAYWAENADVTTTVTGPSIKEILAEIDKLQAEPPSKEELSGIQNYLAGTYVLQNSSRGGITNQLDYMDLHGLPPTYASTYVKQVYAVTPQQISDMAKKHLLDDKALIVIVGDRKVIEEQVKGFGSIMDEVMPELPRAPVACGRPQRRSDDGGRALPKGLRGALRPTHSAEIVKIPEPTGCTARRLTDTFRQPCEVPMADSPDSIVRRWFKEVWDEGREESIDALMAPYAVAYGLPGGPIQGPTAFKPLFRMFRDAPRRSVDRSRANADGRRRWSPRTVMSPAGTPAPPLAASRPASRSTSGASPCIRVEDGKIVEGWNCFDMLCMYQQIGWVANPPLPAQVAPGGAIPSGV